MEDFKFDADNTTVEEIMFKAPMVQKRVPRFQRPYSWEEDQVSEFWTDITSAPETFLLGSIILNYEHEKSKDYVEIIDGQQRLLTITIFMAVLRDILKEIDSESSKRYQRVLISVEDVDGNETYRIACAESIQQFFESNIQNYGSDLRQSKPTTIEEKRVFKNYNFFFEKVSSGLATKETKSEKLKFINGLRDTVMSLVIIHIQIYREEDAYEIFETTNARGIDLNVGDLLKNLIFKNLPPKGNKDIAKAEWDNMEGIIEATSFDLKRFIRYFWISRHAFIPNKKLYRNIKATISDWDQLLKHLVDDAELLSLLLEGSEEDWIERFSRKGSKYFRSISALRYMNVTQCYVFLLALFRHHDQIGINMSKRVEYIEKFTFLYSAISKQPGNRVERIYSRYAIQLEEICTNESGKKLKGKVESLLERLEKELSEEKPIKDTFLDKWMDVRYTQNYKTRALLKYILERFNSHLESTPEKIINFNVVNLEHFIPQNPSSDWGLTKKEIKGYVNYLGNLTLVYDKFNSAAGNKGPKQKIKELKKSDLAVTKDFLKAIIKNKRGWDDEKIYDRQESLGNLAYDNIWKI